jgi:3-methyladenine DNA glycosylase AlkD
MLREVGKRDEKTLERFLNRYATVMPRTSLRYAIERLGVKKRKFYLEMKRV